MFEEYLWKHPTSLLPFLNSFADGIQELTVIEIDSVNETFSEVYLVSCQTSKILELLAKIVIVLKSFNFLKKYLWFYNRLLLAHIVSWQVRRSQGRQVGHFQAIWVYVLKRSVLFEIGWEIFRVQFLLSQQVLWINYKK